MRKAVVFSMALALFGFGSAPAHAITYTTINDPLGVNGTYPMGVSGSNVVGYYRDAAKVAHGFLYDGSTFTTLDDPLASASLKDDGTYALGIDGTTIVGYYTAPHGFYNGFSYDGSTYTKLNYPNANFGETYVTDVSGGKVVGYFAPNPQYNQEFNYKGFVYDGSTYTEVSDPLSITSDGFDYETYVFGIDGQNVVGAYKGADEFFDHGFLYDGSTYTTIDDPLGLSTSVNGISGNLIVGSYFDGSSAIKSFVYDGSTFTTLFDPNSYEYGTYAEDIDGTTVVGYYYGANGLYNGFIAVVPEPSTWLLVASGAIGLIVCAGRARESGAVAQQD